MFHDIGLTKQYRSASERFEVDSANAAPTPRGVHFKEQIIHAFHDGFCHKPETTFGTVNDDVLALHDPKFKRTNFCSIILNSAWRE
jgi:hypothetical protein